MNIFEYIDKKRNEYETLRDESQLQLKTNLNRIQTISSQIKHMTAEEENPSKFFSPETAENYEKEIVELQDKINTLELENMTLSEKVTYCEEELHLLDTLELPDFKSARENMAWTPVVISEEEFQERNVSRETINPLQAEALFAEGFNETVGEIKDLEQLILNVSRETMLKDEEKVNVSRETFSDMKSDDLSMGDSYEIAIGAAIPELNPIKEKIIFCRQISELDPRRCSLLLDEIINEM